MKKFKDIGIMFKGEDIEKLVGLLEKRGAYLYHACQLVDFTSYLAVGGIPSRNHLESMGQPYTKFDTDESDRTKNVWDKVFANLSDFGSTFAGGYAGVPNTYGPILFQIKPQVLREATDVAICLRSAGGQGFDRERESLSSIEGIERLFQYPVDEEVPARRAYVKNRQQLQQDFTSDASAPEISCTVASGLFPMHYVKWIRVESYTIGGKSLHSLVEDLKLKNNLNPPVYDRGKCPPYTNELINILTNEIPSLQNLSQNLNVSEELRSWAKQLMDRKLEYQFIRFAKYFRNGTLLPLIESQM